MPVEVEINIVETWAEKKGQALGDDAFNLALMRVSEKMGEPDASVAHA